eukprot:m51a1_g13432 hypothetical protein (146) ;mRNA; f:528-1464
MPFRPLLQGSTLSQTSATWTAKGSPGPVCSWTGHDRALRHVVVMVGGIEHVAKWSATSKMLGTWRSCWKPSIPLLIDFDLVLVVDDEHYGRDFMMEFNGNLCYASLSAHFRQWHVPTSDLQSLCFVLSEAHKCPLPWMGLYSTCT